MHPHARSLILDGPFLLQPFEYAQITNGETLHAVNQGQQWTVSCQGGLYKKQDLFVDNYKTEKETKVKETK